MTLERSHKILFLGDIHGCFNWYLKTVSRRNNCSLLLGDCGFGFPIEKNKKGKILKESLISKNPDKIPPMPNHKFLVGNHDDRNLVANHPNYIGDYGYDEKSGIFYISGAFSIDFEWRTPGIDWWDTEELTWNQLKDMIELFRITQPRIVASHTAPYSATYTIFPHSIKKWWQSRTEDAMERCLNVWKPKHWFFGHYHYTQKAEIGGTKFRCVGCQQMIELPGVTW